MKGNTEKIKINEEYEKLVPPIERKSLFDDSEDYNSFREDIMAQPVTILHNSKLPFSDVELLEYIPYRFDEAINKATEEHKHLFFITQSVKGQPEYCNAAGYYNKILKKFILLPYSHIVNQTYGVIPCTSLRHVNKNLDGYNCYVTSPIILDDPEKAATFVLGQKAGLDEWVDRRGKGLLEYYPELATKPVSDTVISIPKSSVTKVTTEEKHIFRIFVKGVCKAKGYFDAEKGHFFILKDSFLALNADPEYEKSASGMARRRMLASVCTRNAHFYITNKDTKCRSASAAASYVLGKNSSYVEWEDENGKGLKDFFPERFYRKKNKSQILDLYPDSTSSVKEEIRFFYIKKEGELGHDCDAKGYFDTKTKAFVLKEGSRWAKEVTKCYQFTALEFVRRNHIRRSCKIQSTDIIQTRDILCDSPSAAASFVLGRSANGLDEWKDRSGNTLRDIFKDASIEDAQKNIF
ncbi:MAG: DUF4357 domain-containing protein [Prevotella sp.]|nr:DUF4357 domain-containing protein [Prevotella sp.]